LMLLFLFFIVNAPLRFLGIGEEFVPRSLVTTLNCCGKTPTAARQPPP